MGPWVRSESLRRWGSTSASPVHCLVPVKCLYCWDGFPITIGALVEGRYHNPAYLSPALSGHFCTKPLVEMPACSGCSGIPWFQCWQRPGPLWFLLDDSSPCLDKSFLGPRTEHSALHIPNLSIIISVLLRIELQVLVWVWVSVCVCKILCVYKMKS